MPATKVIEHPDLFVQQGQYKLEDIDYIIELRHHPDEVITYDIIEKNEMRQNDHFGGFGDFNF